MQAATQATLSNLVEQHLTSLIREAATVNRHSKRGGFISAASHHDEDATNDDGNKHGPASRTNPRQRKKRRLIHHDDVNMALLWRGSEKLYVGGVVTPPDSDVEAEKNNTKDKPGHPKQKLSQLLKNVDSKTDVPTLRKSSHVPRIDLNAYLASENTIRPPCEIGMTLHWLAVHGVCPPIPMNDPSNYSHPISKKSNKDNDTTNTIGKDITPLLHETDLIANPEEETVSNDADSSIRIRELQHRLLSEELQLYYSRVTMAFSSPNSSAEVISTALRGIRFDRGIQELVPFLCRFVACGLMEKKNLRNTEYARRLVRVFDAMLDNRSLHLDLHLHQVLTPVGTCIVAKKLSTSPHDDHWALRQESASCLAKACRIYGDQYTTMKPRCIKLLTQQALRMDRSLATQYGGIVGISLFGPRAVDAFLLPLAREYWESWEAKLEKVMAFKEKRDVTTEYELHMCQQALLDAIGIFLQNVTAQEQAKRVDFTSFADIFGERLIPMQPEKSEYLMAIL
ncbi:hypothetical protein HJC23_010670 [Cyclotella cryptica]|uniref:TAF6 C-terminal HEAT repeat domain-containing protein n=1 Tax=Cyclotella cryptica TaxID=29204 RepID=A0ABD3PEP8_9STRA|eukprot:CCRYP_015185-RA/>CCRYP_015185-RA protein AED:0.22 eAED:0.22 QI:93/1/1/1/0.66/0.5/4/1622/510